MDYVEMLKDPELVYGFQELIGDTDSVVVKRTIKVFTSVYYHALRLLATHELEEKVFLSAWASVKGVVDSLMGMISSCENEGVLLQLLRFVEAAVTSHLMYDLTPFPEVFEQGREIVKNGLKALKNLITTPYVGGPSFIVGIRALITIACLRPDLWEPVTDLIKKQMSSLPPTLFDHNVRSLHKTLQRNLFRLLRRAENPELKAKLIEMMVRVGVPRKILVQWAPPVQAKKRLASDFMTESSIVGRPVTPPEKKSKIELKINQTKARSRSNTPEIPKDPRIISKRSLQPIDDNQLLVKESQQASREHQQYSKESRHIPEKSRQIPEKSRQIPEESRQTSNISQPPFEGSQQHSNVAKECQQSSKETQQPPNEIQPKKEIKINSDFMFLASLLPKPFNKEKELYNVLTLNNVMDLVFEGLDYLPDMVPKGLVKDFQTQALISEDVDEMRKHLAYMLTKDLTDKQLKDLVSETKENKKKLPPINKEVITPVSNNTVATVISSSSSSCESSPSSTPPLMDTDMRQLFNQQKPKDIDMRISDSSPASREASKMSDPRLIRDPRLRKEESSGPIDPQVPVPSFQDPRLKLSDDTTRSSRKGNKKSRWNPKSEDVQIPNISDPRIQRNVHPKDPSFTINNTPMDSHFRCPPPAINRDPRFRPNFHVPPPVFGVNLAFPPQQQHQQLNQGPMMINQPSYGWNNKNVSQSLSKNQPRGPLLPTPMVNFS